MSTTSSRRKDERREQYRDGTRTVRARRQARDRRAERQHKHDAFKAEPTMIEVVS